MSSDPPGVTSAQPRGQEKALRDEHRKELQAYKAKFERLRRANDDASRDLFEERNRSERLVKLLGFNTLSEAQLSIEREGGGSYKATLELVDKLKDDLRTIRRENEELREQLQSAKEQERKLSLAKATAIAELKLLQARYDQLVDTHTRAAERYKSDYKKWKRVKDFLWQDHTELREIKKKGLTSPRGIKKLEKDLFEKQRQKFVALNPDPDYLNLDQNPVILTDDEGKENNPQPLAAHNASFTPSPKGSRQASSSSNHSHRLPGISMSPSPIKSIYNQALKADSPLAILDTMSPKPAVDDDDDTEEESSQEMSPLRLSQKHNVNADRDTESALRHDDESKPPRKYRRIDGEGHPGGHKQAVHTNPGPNQTTTSKKPMPLVVSSTSTPTAKPSRDVNDYSAFKGRGRYAKTNTGDKTINGMFEIDRSKNDGLDFQFDNVVRNRSERTKMHAGDCECCRDYYEAVGPLPPRLQAPLWRSPTNTPTKKHHHHASSSTKESVQSHKQKISRHRHNWARPKTPPGYWNIGFPSTQEAAEINEQAREMHKRKLEDIEEEARRSDGRYRRR